MIFKIVLSFIIGFQFLSSEAFARIVNRRVKDAPKVCAYMKVDKMLSTESKTVFGTERHSLIIENDISILNDLGQRKCNWSIGDFNVYGGISQFQYYIDEYKEYLFPYAKTSNGRYTLLKIQLNSCQIEVEENKEILDFPKCEKPKVKKKVRKKKKSV